MKTKRVSKPKMVTDEKPKSGVKVKSRVRAGVNRLNYGNNGDNQGRNG